MHWIAKAPAINRRAIAVHRGAAFWLARLPQPGAATRHKKSRPGCPERLVLYYYAVLRLRRFFCGGSGGGFL